MIRRTLFLIAAVVFPLAMTAQNNWELPGQTDVTPSQDSVAEEVEADVKTSKPLVAREGYEIEVIDGKSYEVRTADKPYLKGAVPEADGQVVFSADIPATGLTAEEAYARVLEHMNKLAKAEGQSEKSCVALVDKENHSIAGTYKEKLTFSRNFISLDQADFNYIMVASCSDGSVHVSIERLTYDYVQAKRLDHLHAEDLITDELTLTNDGTKLRKFNIRFRRATVDRMNEIFDSFRLALQ
ncbi:MAG: DUF4468 domain-containing protein [Prevotella sp.]|nr:DUF4468 domain-containing protein [Prevotella sp.]